MKASIQFERANEIMATIEKLELFDPTDLYNTKFSEDKNKTIVVKIENDEDRQYFMEVSPLHFTLRKYTDDLVEFEKLIIVDTISYLSDKNGHITVKFRNYQSWI